MNNDGSLNNNNVNNDNNVVRPAFPCMPEDPHANADPCRGRKGIPNPFKGVFRLAAAGGMLLWKNMPTEARTAHEKERFSQCLWGMARTKGSTVPPSGDA